MHRIFGGNLNMDNFVECFS